MLRHKRQRHAEIDEVHPPPPPPPPQEEILSPPPPQEEMPPPPLQGQLLQPPMTKCNKQDMVFQHPFTMMISGPTGM